MLARPVIASLVERHLTTRPEAIALVTGERSISFAEFDALSRKSAAWLAARGIRREDRVALWLVNRIEWLALFFGAARIGASIVAINTRYRAAEVSYLLERSGARLLVLQHNFRKIDFAAVLGEMDSGAARSVECVAVVDADGSTPGPILDRPTVAFDALGAPISAAPDGSDPDVVAAMFTTSGTTKEPKLVMHSQRTIVEHARAVGVALGLEERGACLLAALPFCGVFGFCGALAAIAAGAPVVLTDTFDAPEAVRLVHRHAVTHMFGSDEMYRRMMEVAPGHDPFPSARVFGYAAFNPGGEEFARDGWRKRVPFFGLYGSSEVQALFSMQLADAPIEERIQGGGRPVAAPRAEVRVRDVESGELLPPGLSGEIEVRAPGNFAGYWNDPAATAEALCADGFFRTGDIGRLRGDGSFVYETRRGDAMRLGGFLVSPAEIEEVLKQHPDVADVQAVGIDVAGQMRCVAFVILAGKGSPSEADVISVAARQLAAFKVPVRVWFVPEFPVTESANGVKIQRARLREMARERLAAQVGNGG
jgi:fatty-acyl-CoA synthase